MARYACIKNGVIECFMSGDNLTLADAQSGVEALVELPDGEWNYGDTVNTTIGDKITIGLGIPQNAMGTNGWTYIDVNTGNVYKKANNTWF